MMDKRRGLPNRSESSKQTLKSEKRVFEGRKNRLEIEFKKAMNEYEITSEKVQEQQSKFNELCNKQSAVLHLFEMYQLTSSSHRLSISAKKKSSITVNSLAKLDEQVEQLNRMLVEFAEKTVDLGKPLLRSGEYLETHSNLLLTLLDGIEKAKCLKELPKLPLPTLDGIGEISSSEIDKFLDEWEDLQLESSIKNILKQL